MSNRSNSRLRTSPLDRSSPQHVTTTLGHRFVSSQIKVSVGILTFNRRAAVLKAIGSVAGHGRQDTEVVVVDSASTDGTVEAITETYPWVRLVRLPRNVGCPGGRNHVFANCKGKFVVCLDDDGFLSEGALDELVRVFESDPTIGIVAMRQCFTDEPGVSQTMGGSAVVCDVGNFSGGVAAFRREMFVMTGYYPEDFFLYAEESYLAIRALDAGYRIVSAPSIVIWHPRTGGSSGPNPTRWDYYRFRNPILVAIRLYPFPLWVQYLIMRMGSGLLVSFQRGSVLHFFHACGTVFASLPREIMRRRPCSGDAVRLHLRLRTRKLSTEGEGGGGPTEEPGY